MEMKSQTGCLLVGRKIDADLSRFKWLNFQFLIFAFFQAKGNRNSTILGLAVVILYVNCFLGSEGKRLKRVLSLPDA